MEQNTLKETRKYFSSLGLRLFIGVLIIYAVQFLGLFIFEKVGEAVPSIGTNANIRFLSTMLPMYIIAYPLIFLLLKKLPSQQTGEPKKMKFIHIFAAFLMLYAGTYICNIFGTIITTIIGIIKQSAVNNVMMEITGSLNPVINFIIVVICAPIMEELLYRKALIDRTVKYGEGISVVLSGLLFSLFHGNLNQFAYTFFMGCFFGFIYVKTKRIIYPIILHMVANFVGSFVSTFFLSISGINEINAAMLSGATETELMNVMMEHAAGLVAFFGYFLCLIGFVIAGIVLFIVKHKKFTFAAGEVTIEKGQRFKTVLCNVGMGLFCIFWIVMIIFQLFQ